MGTLTAAERVEIDGIRYRLLDAEGRMTKDCYTHRMPVMQAINAGDIEMLRVYDKFLMSTLASTYHLGVMYRSALALGQIPSEFITRDHVTVWEGWLSRALRNGKAGEHRSTKPGNDDAVCTLMLADISRGPLMLTLINDRGLIDAEALGEVLAAMESGAKALAEGAL